jgi:hypothetical protein
MRLSKTGNFYANQFIESGITDGLIGYWNFAQYPTFLDLSSTRNHGTAVTAYSSVGTGVKGKSLIVDSTAERIRASIPTLETGSTSYNSGLMTIMFWVKYLADPQSNCYTICRYVWRFRRLTSNEISVTYGRMTNSAGPTRTATSSGANIQKNKWYHLTTTYAPTAHGGNDTIELFINGESYKTANLDGLEMWTGYGDTVGIRFGGTNHGTWNPETAEFDQFKIFNRILTDQEIKDECSFSGQMKVSLKGELKESG